MIFPFISTEITTPNKATLPLYREFAWDYNTNDVKLVNGNPHILEGNEAIKVWCYKALLTPRYQYSIYSWDYGSQLQELIGKAYTRGLTEEESKRYVKDALMINPYIEDVTVDNSRFDGDKLYITATVTTIYGDIKVVI